MAKVEIIRNEKGYSIWQDGKKVGDVGLFGGTKNVVTIEGIAAQIAELEQRVERLEEVLGLKYG